jgi:hypothetical protein
VAVRTASAAAVLAAAAVVYALVQSRRNQELNRLLVRERASGRLMAGCLARDREVFIRRLNAAMAQDSVAAAAGRRLDGALAHNKPTTPPMEGGPR